MTHFLKIALVFLVISSCQSIEKDEIIGKWYDEDNDFELWISDSLTLGYSRPLDVLYLYKINVKNNVINFELLDSDISSNPKYSTKIIELTDNSLTTEYIGQSLSEKKQVLSLLSKKIPVIHTDFAKNEVYLEEFRKNASGKSIE